MKSTSEIPAGNPFGFKFVAPLALGSILNPINSTMLATALVPIGNGLHAGPEQTGWLIAALYMTSAVAQPTMGRLVDLFGPKRVYLWALGLLAVAGVISLVATTLPALIFVRVLLGIGTSGAYPAAMRIFRVRADRLGAKPPRIAMGLLSLSAIATTAIGPTIGGLLTAKFGWHSIFTVNLPLALGTAALVAAWTPNDEPGDIKRNPADRMDIAGVLYFAAFLLCLMTFLMNLKHANWWALAAAACFCAVLIRHSARLDQPFIDVRMLARNRPLSITYIRAGLVSMIVYSVFYGFAPWLESSVGLSSAHAGLVTLPMSALAGISSVTGVRTKGLKAPFVVSIGAAVLGCVFLHLIGNHTPIWLVAGAVMLFGVPQGTFNTATQAAVYIQAPPDEIGAAAGLQRTAWYIGAIAAASLLAFMYGKHVTTDGLHGLATVMGVLSAILFVMTLFDRTIPSAAATGDAASGAPAATAGRAAAA